MANKAPRYYRPALLCIIVFHLSVSGVYNLWASLEGWCRTRPDAPHHKRLQAMRHGTQRLALTPVFSLYARMAGLNTGYTFFSPQVGSFYYYEVAILSDTGDETLLTRHPPLGGSEGYLRYQNFLGVFQALLSADDDPLELQEKRYARALAKSMGTRLLQDTAGYRWRLDVSAYATRPLSTSSGRPLVSLVTLYADTLTYTPADAYPKPIPVPF